MFTKALRRIKDFLFGPKTPYGVRGWVMWGYRIGKEQGKKEALAELPIVQVQPRQQTTTKVYLPPGEWTRQWRESHLIVRRENTEPIDPQKDFPDWLNSFSTAGMTPDQIASVPTVRDLTPEFDPLNTDEYPAVVALLHQDLAQKRRHAG